MTYYANLYLTNRAYGGPEEGGWWYGTGEPVKSNRFATRSAAELALPALEGEAAARNVEEKRRRPSSMACDGWYDIRLESGPARAYPERRPQYDYED